MNLDFYLRDIAFFDGTCYSCKTHCNKTINCTEDKDKLVDQVRIITISVYNYTVLSFYFIPYYIPHTLIIH